MKLTGRAVSAGVAEGLVLASHQPMSFLGGVDRESGGECKAGESGSCAARRVGQERARGKRTTDRHGNGAKRDWSYVRFSDDGSIG